MSTGRKRKYKSRIFIGYLIHFLTKKFNTQCYKCIRLLFIHSNVFTIVTYQLSVSINTEHIFCGINYLNNTLKYNTIYWSYTHTIYYTTNSNT